MANVQAAYKWNSIVEPGVTSTFSDAQTAEPIVYFTTENDSAYLVTAEVVAVATDNYDEVNAYIIAGTFENDGGTLTQTGSTTPIHSDEAHAGWAVDFAVNSPDIRVVFTTDDTTPVTVRTVLRVVALRSKSPHFYGTSTNA